MWWRLLTSSSLHSFIQISIYRIFLNIFPCISPCPKFLHNLSCFFPSKSLLFFQHSTSLLLSPSSIFHLSCFFFLQFCFFFCLFFFPSSVSFLIDLSFLNFSRIFLLFFFFFPIFSLYSFSSCFFAPLLLFFFSTWFLFVPFFYFCFILFPDSAFPTTSPCLYFFLILNQPTESWFAVYNVVKYLYTSVYPHYSVELLSMYNQYILYLIAISIASYTMCIKVYSNVFHNLLQ